MTTTTTLMRSLTRESENLNGGRHLIGRDSIKREIVKKSPFSLHPLMKEVEVNLFRVEEGNLSRSRFSHESQMPFQSGIVCVPRPRPRRPPFDAFLLWPRMKRAREQRHPFPILSRKSRRENARQGCHGSRSSERGAFSAFIPLSPASVATLARSFSALSHDRARQRSPSAGRQCRPCPEKGCLLVLRPSSPN